MKKAGLLLLFLLVLTSINIAQKPYVLLVSFDAFRWDYLNRNITPNLEKIYAEGVRAISLQPVFPSKTFPNHISIITGMYPENHGIITNTFENPTTNEWYKLSDRNSVQNSKWYLGEPFWETAKRNGIKTACFVWPSSSVADKNYRCDHYKLYDGKIPNKVRVDSIISWLNKPYSQKPRFITLYFSDTDDYGHRYGPNSKEINVAISRLDSIAGYIMSSLDKIGMKDSVNVIFVSDHGMTEISKDKLINIEKLLNGFDVKLSNVGSLMMVEPKRNQIDEVYNYLKSHAEHFTVYKRDEVPEYFHFSKNPFIYSIVLIADLHWSLVDNRHIEMFTSEKWDNAANHGYDNHELDMHGYFVAEGPAFKKGYQCGTLLNIDIYPLLCKIFDIYPRSNIDGKLERIGFILK